MATFAKGKHRVENFVFISRSKTPQTTSFLFPDSCLSVAQMPKISFLALTVASLDNYLALHARCNCRLFVFIAVWCIARQADRNGEIFIKVLSQFHAPYCRNLGRKIAGRSEAVRTTMHRYHTNNFRFQIMCQNIVSAFYIAAVCCNSYVQENLLSSNRLTSRQNPILAFRI